MLKGKNIGAALRRDIFFVWHALIVFVFAGFAGLALAATVIDIFR
jgi:hypothetical protein